MTNFCQRSTRCKCLVMAEMMTAAMELAVEDLLLFGRENGIELLDRLHAAGCLLLGDLQERRLPFGALRRSQRLGRTGIGPSGYRRLHLGRECLPCRLLPRRQRQPVVQRGLALRHPLGEFLAVLAGRTRVPGCAWRLHHLIRRGGGNRSETECGDCDYKTLA